MLPGRLLSRKGGAQQNLFVDSQDSNAKKKVRSHVAREFQRRQRWERNEPLEPKGSRNIKIPLEWPPLGPSHYPPTKQPESNSFVSQSKDSSVERANEDTEDGLSRLALLPKSNPVSKISSFRSDPFSSFPIAIREQDRVVINHYLCVYPEMMFRLRQSYNPALTICFTMAMKGPISFQATVMAVGSAHLSALRGFRGEKAEPSSINHKVKALHMMNEGVRTINTETCVDILFGILSIANAEDRFGDTKASLTHLRGALHIVEKFRDLPTIRDHHWLTMYINWVVISNAGHDEYALRRIVRDDGLDQEHGAQASAMVVSASNGSNVSHTEALHAFKEFTAFLRNAEHLSLSQCSPSSKRATPLRHTSFSPSTPVYRLLTTSSLTSTIPRIQRSCRLACLVFLNAALWSFRKSPPKTSQFLASLSAKILEHGLDQNVSLESFTLSIMEGIDDELHLEAWIWFTGRMITVAKRLERESWERVKELLMSSLTLRDPGGDSLNGNTSSSFLDWEDDLMVELLEAPLSCDGLAPAFR